MALAEQLPRHRDDSPFGTAGDDRVVEQIRRAGPVNMAEVCDTQARMRMQRADAARRAEAFEPEDPEWFTVTEYDPHAGFDRALRYLSGAVLIGLGVFTGLLICAAVTDPEWLAGWL